jgi:hypothetical protein
VELSAAIEREQEGHTDDSLGTYSNFSASGLKLEPEVSLFKADISCQDVRGATGVILPTNAVVATSFEQRVAPFEANEARTYRIGAYCVGDPSFFGGVALTCG